MMDRKTLFCVSFGSFLIVFLLSMVIGLSIEKRLAYTKGYVEGQTQKENELFDWLSDSHSKSLAEAIKYADAKKAEEAFCYAGISKGFEITAKNFCGRDMDRTVEQVAKEHLNENNRQMDK